MKRLWFYLALIAILGSASHARQSIQTAFAPSPESTELVVSTIASADDSIELAAYTFTSQPVAEALVGAKDRGVDVRVLVDKTQRKGQYSVVPYLAEHGIPIRIDRHHAIMHNKFIVIDEKTIETGSFNYTKSAERKNAENILVIHDNKKLARKYLDDWQALWDDASEYVP